jgi:hypothetical protein
LPLLLLAAFAGEPNTFWAISAKVLRKARSFFVSCIGASSSSIARELSHYGRKFNISLCEDEALAINEATMLTLGGLDASIFIAHRGRDQRFHARMAQTGCRFEVTTHTRGSGLAIDDLK